MKVFNSYQEVRKVKIATEISTIELSLVDYETKLDKRIVFVEKMDEVFNLEDYYGNVDAFFNDWLSRSEKQSWIDYIVNTYNKKRKINQTNVLTKEEFANTLNTLYESVQESDEANQKYDKINELNSERDKLFFFVRDGYTKSVFLFLIIELLVLYILRYSYYGVRSLNNYLKDE